MALTTYGAILWLKDIKKRYIHGGDESYDENRKQAIDIAIKALEQPEIVRCKDCKHRDETTEDCANVDSVCYRNGYIKEDWFCADGERKDGDGE